tara:strand:- start:4309 stop:4743 length:435 start_codon:yes stop_codon:yes gene_type:complete
MTSTQLVDVSPLAADKLSDLLKEHGDDGSLVRIMVMPGANGGIQYSMGLEKEAREDDTVIDAGSIQVIVDSESVPLVDGAQIDYVDGLQRSGFTISNPNQQLDGGGGGCGCGGGGGGGGCGGGGGGCGCGGGGGGCGGGGGHGH